MSSAVRNTLPRLGAVVGGCSSVGWRPIVSNFNELSHSSSSTSFRRLSGRSIHSTTRIKEDAAGLLAAFRTKRSDGETARKAGAHARIPGSRRYIQSTSTSNARLVSPIIATAAAASASTAPGAAPTRLTSSSSAFISSTRRILSRTFSTTPLAFILRYAHPKLSSRLNASSSRSLSSSPLTRYGRSGGRRSGGGGRNGNSWQRFKYWLDTIPPMRVVYALIGINVGVFLLWQYAMTSWQRFRDPSLYYWMTNNFIVSEANLMAGRVYTLLTCCFSHSSGSHIFLNMLGLYFIAPSTVAVLGTASFLGLYLGAGIVSSLVSLVWHRMADRGRTRKSNHGSEGASGAIYACLSFFAATFPKTQFLMFFVIPMPAWVAVGGIFAYDLYLSISTPNAKTDSAGHIGGILAGIAFALVRRGRGRF